MNTIEECESDSSDSELQIYSLVQFIHRGRKKKVEDVDIVPSKWLDFNKKTGRMTTKFLEIPYTSEDIATLHTLVKDNVDAPEAWPTFNVKVLGRASTYALAMIKVKRLETETNVFTADSGDDSVSVKQDKIKAAVQQNALKKQALLLKEKHSQRKAANDSIPNKKSHGNVLH